MAFSQGTFESLIWGWIALALITVPVQLVLTPAYGRHARARWGPVMDNRAGWIVMELVSPIALLWPFAFLGPPESVPAAILVSLWVAHYFNRSVIYPLTTRTSGKTIPVVIVLASIAFNAVNGWTNGLYLDQGWAEYSPSWLHDPRFVLGLLVFLTGAAINIRADRTLVGLRQKGGPQRYSIPRGGLFDRISCPNHLGEIIEWAGFALACWNLPALAFAVWTAANLGPRAIAHHRWYKATFPDYPADRKALIPYLL
jgi:3-oxo-5-alpha-steroid 4-dehydrogenase 1